MHDALRQMVAEGKRLELTGRRCGDTVQVSWIVPGLRKPECPAWIDATEVAAAIFGS